MYDCQTIAKQMFGPIWLSFPPGLNWHHHTTSIVNLRSRTTPDCNIKIWMHSHRVIRDTPLVTGDLRMSEWLRRGSTYYVQDQGGKWSCARITDHKSGEKFFCFNPAPHWNTMLSLNMGCHLWQKSVKLGSFHPAANGHPVGWEGDVNDNRHMGCILPGELRM